MPPNSVILNNKVDEMKTHVCTPCESVAQDMWSSLQPWGRLQSHGITEGGQANEPGMLWGSMAACRNLELPLRRDGELGPSKSPCWP